VTLLEEVRRVLTETVRAIPGASEAQVAIESPPSAVRGDLATPVCFELARLLRRPPKQSAAELVERLKAAAPAGVSRIEAAGGGYLNVFVDRTAFLGEFSREALGGFAAPAGASAARLIVEHTNINPNKAAHIGHLRNAVLGDTLVRCLRRLGRRAEVQNYIDDTGVQVADLAVGFRHIEGLAASDVRALAARCDAGEAAGGPPFDHVCWDLYARVAPWYEEDPARPALRSRALHEMESGSGADAEMAAFLAARMCRHHLRTMDRLGIRYDLLPRESDILHLEFWASAFERLKAHGAVRLADEGKNKGCWVMDLADTDDSEKVIVRSDGTVTYVGKDIAYQMWKFGLLGRDFGYRPISWDGFPWSGYPAWETCREHGVAPHPEVGGAARVYNVIDVGQSYLQRVVVQALQALGHAKEAEASTHFSYEKVALSPASVALLLPGYVLSDEDKARPWLEMSGRKGLGVKADDLIAELKRRAEAEVGRRHPDLARAERDDTARRIAVAALRYYMLRTTKNRVVAFDIDEALSFEGETGPYCQYAVVRARSILAKAAAESGEPGGREFVERLAREASGERAQGGTPAMASLDAAAVDHWQLVRDLAGVTATVAVAVETLELATLARYVHRLAQGFNTFYHQNPVLPEPDPGLRRLRLGLCALFVLTMEAALDLLGIEAPERM
jgi:arginyl-tRNA synthetase